MIERLNKVLRSLGHEPGLDDLRDILWLAQHLPPAKDRVSPEKTPTRTSIPAHDKPPAAQRGSAPTIAESKTSSPRTRRVLVEDWGLQSSDAGVFTRAGGRSGIKASRVSIPGAAPLPEALALGRALRPLGRRRLSETVRVLDERASADNIAETGLPLPVFRPAWERWFDVVLAVEEVPSLVAWRPTVREFSRLLHRHGGFRSVTRLRLVARERRVAIHSFGGPEIPPSSLYDRHARRIFLIVSDCTSAAWHDGAVGDLIDRMGHRLPVAVVQLLPRELWPNTAVSFAEFQVSATAPGLPTSRLRLRRPDWAEGETGTVVPVFPLQPAPVAAWARMLMAAGSARAPATLLPLPDVQAKAIASAATPADTTSAEQKVSAFRAATLGDAQRLAAYFSVVKPLTLPVMRLIQTAMLPQTGPVALAQVLLGGIMRPVGAAAHLAEEAIEYDFHEGVRELLGAGVKRSEFFAVNLALQAYIERELGQPFKFFAYLEDVLGDEEIALAALPFARFAREIADRFRTPGTRPPTSGPRQRYVEETVFARGLTERAEIQLPAPASRLEWSPDGKVIAVLHGTGVDVLESHNLAVSTRERELPLRGAILAHSNVRAALQPLVRMLEHALERRSGRPWSLIIQAWDIPDEVTEGGGLSQFSATLEQVIMEVVDEAYRDTKRGEIEALAIILLAFTEPIDLKTFTLHGALPIDRMGVLNDMAYRILGLPISVPGSISPGISVNGTAGVDTKGWEGILSRPLASNETAQAVDSLADYLIEDDRPSPNRAIVGMAWSGGHTEPTTLRVPADSSTEVTLIGPAGEERLLDTFLDEAEIVDFDVSDEAVLVTDSIGRVWLHRRAGEPALTLVAAAHETPSETDMPAAVRWAPNGREYVSIDRSGRVRWWTLHRPEPEPISAA